MQKKVVMISILMQGTNQKCNALESVFGIFLHSCNTPQKVIDMLAHMGITISVKTHLTLTDFLLYQVQSDFWSSGVVV